MATITITPGNTFTATETVTSTKLNDLGSPTAALTAASIGTADIADDAITPALIADNAVTTPAILDANVTFAKLTDVIDDDTMATATDTTLATSESIKAYADGTVSTSENGYMKLPSGVIMQWGTLTPSARLTDVTLSIAFPNACLNVQASIGADFTDGAYEDNSLIWGGFPTSGDLSKITIMSHLRFSNTGVTYRKMFWQAIGY